MFALSDGIATWGVAVYIDDTIYKLFSTKYILTGMNNMNNKTEINPNINATVINSELGTATVINPNVVSGASKSISTGARLGGKYEIIKPLGTTTGEADIYVCKFDSTEYVAKVYRRQRAVKPEVVSALKSICSPYVATLIDTGEYNGLPYEILPYYRNGSLQGKRFTLDELKERIIPFVNEALRVLHQHDIIHKDLKPSNIMLLDDQKSVAIIDFGISSVIEQGNTVLVTKTGMTPEYSAPETFRNLFLEESDYYSFGITLYELYSGYTPYKNMDADEIAKFTAVQRIPFPKDMPKELQDLISAVTYFDITNRNDKENPNRRWTYDEVQKWCKGESQPIPGEGVMKASAKAIPPYSFLGHEYHDISSLTVALASNWNDGKKQLYRGLMSAFFKSFNPEIAGFCIDAEEEAARSTDREDIIFWEFLYKINPELDGFYWMGHTYESLGALGQDILEKLWKNDQSDYTYWDSVLGNKLLTNYLTTVKSKNTGLSAAVSALETAHSLINRSKRDALINYYTMAYLLSGQKLFNIGNKQLKNISELTAYMKTLLDSSYKEFEDFCHTLIGYDNTLDVQLEAWLIALGKRKEVEAWRIQLSQ